MSADTGYTSRKFVAFDPSANTADVPMYVVVQGAQYRLTYDLSQATLWNAREDIEAYFRALHPDALGSFVVSEVELRVLHS